MIHANSLPFMSILEASQYTDTLHFDTYALRNDNLQTSEDCTGGDFRHGMDKVSVAQINFVVAQQVASFDGFWDGELSSVVGGKRDEQHPPRRLLRLEGAFKHVGGRILEVPRTSDIVAILRIRSIIGDTRWRWRSTWDGKGSCRGCARRVTDRLYYYRAVIATELLFSQCHFKPI